MDLDDAADLLGSNELPVRQSGALQALHAFFNTLLSITGVAGAMALAYYVHNWLNDWREQTYKKSLRRKYGIPDDDNEPFNVAYAKVQARRKERSGRPVGRQPVSETNTTSSGQSVSSTTTAESNLLGTRHQPVTKVDSTPNDLPGGMDKLFSSPAPATKGASGATGIHNGAREADQTKADIVEHNYAASGRQRKRSLDKDGLDGSVPQSHHGPGPGEQTAPIAQDAKVDGTKGRSSGRETTARGAKRQAASDEDISNVGSVGKKAGKRARRQSRKFSETLNGDNQEEMDVDHISRGRKRDRIDAESTFGDDESAVGHRGRKSRRQNRKSSAAVDIDGTMPARGTKRSYEVESTLGSEDDSASRAGSPRKRGKRMDDATKHVESQVPGRKIGEEWQANGVTYRVGPDGRKQRQVLVRKRASRFSMPEDSQHPDSQARLDIMVETWSNDDEYAAAVKRGEIYVPNKKSRKPEVRYVAAEPGKPLLWKSDTPSKSGYNDVYVLDDDTGVDPFERPSMTGNPKRIVLNSPVESPNGASSPALRSSKSYSKWEKQDLEAEAMSKLRKKLEGQKKDASPTPVTKKVTFQLPTESTTASPSASTVSSSAPAPAPVSASFEPSKQTTPAPTSTTNPPLATTDNTKDTAPSTTVLAGKPFSNVKLPSFTLPQLPTSKDSSKESSTMAAPASKFSFGPPSGSTQPAQSEVENNETTKSADSATPSTGAAPSIPNFFGPKTSGTSNATAASSSSIFGKPAQPNASVPAATGTTPTFSFGIKGPAQGEKAAESSAKPTDKTVSPAPSFFPAPAKDAMPSGTTGTTTGATNGNTARPASSALANGMTTTMPQFSFNAPANKQTDTTNKPAEQAGAIAVPKFNFGFGPKPAATSSTSQLASQPTTTAGTQEAKPATQAPPFSFSSTPTQGTSTGVTPGSAASTSTAPKFSFGFGQTSTSMAQVPTTSGTSSTNISNDNKTASTNTPTINGTAAPTGFSFNFAASKPADVSSSAFGNTSSSSLSPFGAVPVARPAEQAPATFGSTTSAFGNPSNATAPASSSGFGTSSNVNGFTSTPMFGNTSNANGTSSTQPFGGTSNTNGTGTNPSAFGNTANSTTSAFGNAANSTAPAQASGFGSTNGPITTPAFGSTAFGNTNTANVTPSLFGQQQTKPAAEPSKPMFMFGTGTNNASSNNNSINNASGEKQETKPTFSFNFGPKPTAAPAFGSTSTPGTANAVGTSPFGSSTTTTGGSSAPFTFGAPKPGTSPFGMSNTNGTTNTFGSTNGTSIFGQKS